MGWVENAIVYQNIVVGNAIVEHRVLKNVKIITSEPGGTG
jgi:hypothetical protein